MKKLLIAVLFILGSLSVYFIDILSLLFKASDPSLAAGTWSITKIFLYIILVLFWIGFIQIFLRWKRLSGFSQSIPSHLTALGILGTFIGIFVGLYKFDVQNLHTSVPLLLDGMKLAFSTSIAGLTTSTFLKVSQSISISIFQDTSPTGNLPDDEPNINMSDPTLLLLMSLSESEFNERLERLKKFRQEFEGLFKGNPF